MVQGDKKSPLAKDVVEEVTKAIDALVESVEDGTPYADLDALKLYIQWTIDYGKYEEALTKYKEDLRAAEANREAAAGTEFRSMNGRLFEEVRWDWSPIWQVLAVEEGILSTLPTLPWRHDGESLPLYYMSITTLNIRRIPEYFLALLFD